MDYSKMTQTEYDDCLSDLVHEMSADEILAAPGAYEALSEELNNEILSLWESKQENK